MTDAQIIARLIRTTNSINAFMDRGGSLGRNGNVNNRGCELVDRYDDLRDALNGGSTIENGYSAAWRKYCADMGACPSHNGHDLFA